MLPEIWIFLSAVTYIMSVGNMTLAACLAILCSRDALLKMHQFWTKALDWHQGQNYFLFVFKTEKSIWGTLSNGALVSTRHGIGCSRREWLRRNFLFDPSLFFWGWITVIYAFLALSFCWIPEWARKKATLSTFNTDWTRHNMNKNACLLGREVPPPLVGLNISLLFIYLCILRCRKVENHVFYGQLLCGDQVDWDEIRGLSLD